MIIENKMIVKSTTVNCGVTEAWKRWTTHEGLLTFFGADNKIELCLGGAFEIYFMMDASLGLRGSEGCKIISFLPEKMLSFTWNAPPQFEMVRNNEYKTWVVVNFDVVDENKTKVSLHHLGWLKGEEWNKVYSYFENAWGFVMERFERSV